MKVRDLMSQNVASCRSDTGLEEVARMMQDCDCGAIPVVDDQGKAFGIITDRDIVIRAVAGGRNPLEMNAGDIMTTPVTTVRADADLHECERLMEQRQLRRILVIEDDGACYGIVSQADIARRAPKEETAEVVRDISQPAYMAGQAAYPA